MAVVDMFGVGACDGATTWTLNIGLTLASGVGIGLTVGLLTGTVCTLLALTALELSPAGKCSHVRTSLSHSSCCA